MNINLNQELKAKVKKAKLPETNFCENNFEEPENDGLTLLSKDFDDKTKQDFSRKKLELENEKFKIEIVSLATDNRLKVCFALFIILLLSFQTVTIFVFLFIHHSIFNAKYLTGIILTIIGQSYFLPSFLAQYLFKNNGVKTDLSLHKYLLK